MRPTCPWTRVWRARGRYSRNCAFHARPRRCATCSLRNANRPNAGFAGVTPRCHWLHRHPRRRHDGHRHRHRRLDAGTGVTAAGAGRGAALERGRQRVCDHYQGRWRRGKLQAAAAANARPACQPPPTGRRWPRADLVIEAVFEDMAVKQDVFRRIDPSRTSRRGAGHQHLLPRRGRHRQRHRRARRTCWACTSSVRPTS